MALHWLKSNVFRSWYIWAIVPRSGYIKACDQSMVESGVTEGRKNTASFLFREWTRQHKHQTSSLKATIFNVIPEEKQQLVEEKEAANIRKVLCKSFIPWFWELNLCSYQNGVDSFDSLWFFFCRCWSESLERITKHLMSGSSENQLVLFPESPDVSLDEGKIGTLGKQN